LVTALLIGEEKGVNGIVKSLRHVPTAVQFGFVPPLIPVLVEQPPAGDGWLHEIKQDGYRTQLVLDRGNARAFTRRGNDWTARYGRIVSAAAHLRCRSAILDGEVIVQDANGVSDFGVLRSAIDYEPHRLLFYAFDLLHLNGKDLRGVPLIERRDALRRLLDGAAGDGAIQFSEHTDGSGAEVFVAAESMGLEGIVSKRAASRYVSGSSRNWLKTKCFAESDLILIGTEIGKDGKPVALLARHAEGKLAFAGGALIALPSVERDRLWNATEPLEVSRPAFRLPGRRNARWLKPDLVVRVRHLKASGKDLRHATVLALAADA
jgi:bifunctional non-homologous end joining protein LigD